MTFPANVEAHVYDAQPSSGWHLSLSESFAPERLAYFHHQGRYLRLVLCVTASKLTELCYITEEIPKRCPGFSFVAGDCRL